MNSAEKLSIALVGAGKTGGKLPALAEAHETVEVFNTAHRPTTDALGAHDVIISFLPPAPFGEYAEMFIETALPLVSGTTGVGDTDALSARLQENNLTWVMGSNFAPGMILVRELVEKIGASAGLFDRARYRIHDVHNARKVDAPSGTALLWREWLGAEAEFTDERTGDVIGVHSLTLDTPHEQLTLTHSVKDRALYAAGALWAARYLVQNFDRMERGIVPYEAIAKKRNFGRTAEK